MKKYPLFIAFLAVCIAFMVVLSQAADDDIFLQQEFTVGGEILACRHADFNGDTLPDLAIIASETSGERVLLIYIQRDSRRFPPTASQRIVVTNTVNMIQAADVDMDGKSEIFLIDHNGVWMHRYGNDSFNDSPRHVIKQSTIFNGGIRGTILNHKFLHAISGKLTAFVPTAVGFALFSYAGGQFIPISEIAFSHFIAQQEAPVKSFINRPTIFAMTLPTVYISDYNRDDLSDIYLLWPNRLEMFPQNQRGRFISESKLVFNFNKYTRDNLCQSILVDFDRDGILDLVCCHSIGGLSDARTEIRFFGASQILNNDHVERHTINLTDICGNIMIGNYDGTGGPELVVPAIELGILTTVKNMISKKTDFHFLIYPIDNLGRPAKDPKVRRQVTCRLDFEQSDPTGNFRIHWSGDYNNDGLLDLVTADGKQLMFYPGKADEYVEKKAGLVLDIENVETILGARLNNDSNSDIIILHEPGRNSQQVTLLVTNRVF